MRLSTVIITRNESRHISDCILSVQGFSDEVLVLDSFSTDDTRALAEALGARVVQHEFEGYGASKNRANELARGSFIFSLDADERPDAQLAESISKAVRQGTDRTAFRMQRLNWYCGVWIKHGAWNPDRKIRLWKKGQASWDLSEVHEQVILMKDIVVEDLPGKILHYSYHSEREHLEKIERYARRGALEMQKNGRRFSFFRQWFSPLARWFRDYILKAGFLDGKAGWQIARLTAREVWLKYRFLREPGS